MTASKIAGLNKLMFVTCNTSYQLLGHTAVFCSFPGAEVGDRIIITAQEFLQLDINAPFDCAVVSSAKVSQPDNVRIFVDDACNPTPPPGITIRATFAMIAYHE